MNNCLPQPFLCCLHLSIQGASEVEPSSDIETADQNDDYTAPVCKNMVINSICLFTCYICYKISETKSPVANSRNPHKRT